MYKMEGVADWLMRTQDPSGGFAYQGKSHLRELWCRKIRIRFAKAWRRREEGFVYPRRLVPVDLVPKKKEDLPSALKEVKRKRKTRKSEPHANPDQSPSDARTQVRVNEWMKKHYSINPQFAFPILLLLRPRTLHEFSRSSEQTSEKEPKWYNDGVDYIIHHQNDDGSCTEEGSEVGA